MTRTRTLQLIEVTSETQANNGTQCFHDPIAKCDYLSYESGYVRRQYTYMDRRGNIKNTAYQLNKTKVSRVGFESIYSSASAYKRKERILEMDPEVRIDIIIKATVNYRNYLKN